MAGVDDNSDRLDTDPGGPGGAAVAIGLLVLIVLLLVFLFREELGIGSPSAEITIPETFETEIPEPPVEDVPEANADAPASEETLSNAVTPSN